MIPFRPLSGQVQVYFVLFTSLTFAALQNVTVDDAVLTGTVIPQYMPSDPAWNIGNNCTVCLVKPDPALAYNGTWHDTTFSPGDGVSQGIEFTFTGSALYIFFIIANNITGAITFTAVDFLLDNAAVNTYVHTPAATHDYQYNVPVYVNELLAPGEHTMMIQPINSGNQVLILFDYLMYSTDPSSSVSSSAQATSTLPSTSTISTSAMSTTLSETQGTTSSDIVGGTVGGVAVLVLVAAFLLCYRRYTRSATDRPPVEDGTVVDPFIISHGVPVAPTSLTGMKSSPHLMDFPFAKPALRTDPSTTTLQPLTPPVPTSGTASSSLDTQSRNNPGIHEQVELLRGEVARLRNLQDLDRNIIESRSEAPPGYS